MGGGMRRISRGGREGPPRAMWAASAVIGAALLVMWIAVATTFGSCAMPDAMNGMQEARVVPPQGGAGGDSDSEGGWRARAQAARAEIRYACRLTSIARNAGMVIRQTGSARNLRGYA